VQLWAEEFPGLGGGSNSALSKQLAKDWTDIQFLGKLLSRLRLFVCGRLIIPFVIHYISFFSFYLSQDAFFRQEKHSTGKVRKKK
jgi:hypothetical protein